MSKELSKHGIEFSVADILDIDSFPKKSFSVVNCSHAIEHIEDWRTAFKNLLELAELRLIVSFPFKRSLNDPGHCNYWDNEEFNIFNDVHDFQELALPFASSICKQRTNKKDVGGNDYEYLLIVDKRQKYNV